MQTSIDQLTLQIKSLNFMNKKTKKKINKSIKYLIVIALVAFISYWGQGNEYIQEGLDQLRNKLNIELSTNDKEDIDHTEEVTANKRLTGKIIKVIDGDTVTLLDNNGKKRKIRLDGIDCPETGQEYGEEATRYVEKIAMSKCVCVEIKGTDIYNRTLGIIYVDDLNINEQLLTKGLAWVYKYNKDPAYHQLERKAREKKKNIWSNPNSVDPSTWRKNKK